MPAEGAKPFQLKPYGGTIDKHLRNDGKNKTQKPVSAPKDTPADPLRGERYVPTFEKRVKVEKTLKGPAPEKRYEPQTAKRQIESKTIKFAAVAKAVMAANNKSKGVVFEPTSAERKVENETLTGPKPETPQNYFPYYRSSPQHPGTFEPVIFQPSYLATDTAPTRAHAATNLQMYRERHDPYYPSMVSVETRSMDQSEATARNVSSQHPLIPVYTKKKKVDPSGPPTNYYRKDGDTARHTTAYTTAKIPSYTAVECVLRGMHGFHGY